MPKLSSYPDAGTLDGTETVPLIVDGANKTTTAQEIADLASGGGVVESSGSFSLTFSTFASDISVDFEYRKIGHVVTVWTVPGATGTSTGVDLFSTNAMPVAVRPVTDLRLASIAVNNNQAEAAIAYLGADGILEFALAIPVTDAGEEHLGYGEGMFSIGTTVGVQGGLSFTYVTAT